MEKDEFEQKLSKIDSDLKLAHKCAESAENIAKIINISEKNKEDK